jgi:hypothetical protein
MEFTEVMNPRKIGQLPLELATNTVPDTSITLNNHYSDYTPPKQAFASNQCKIAVDSASHHLVGRNLFATLQRCCNHVCWGRGRGKGSARSSEKDTALKFSAKSCGDV